MKEDLFWEERDVNLSINENHLEFYKTLHPKQIIVDRTELPLHVYKVFFKATTSRGNIEELEKVILTSSPLAADVIGPRALQQWHKEKQSKEAYRSYKNIEYTGCISLLKQTELASITIEQGEELDLKRLCFSSKIFNLFKLALQGFSGEALGDSKAEVQFTNLENLLGDVHSKQIICYEMDMNFSVEQITFSYSKNNKKRTTTKSFIISQKSATGSTYLDKHSALARISNWMNSTNKKFSNVKVLENSIVSNVGTISIN